MKNEERIKKLEGSKYQELFGVKKETFERMRATVPAALKKGIAEKRRKLGNSDSGCH